MSYVCITNINYNIKIVYQGTYDECMQYKDLSSNDNVSIYPLETISNAKFLA